MVFLRDDGIKALITEPAIKFIAAMSWNRVIGKAGEIPWHDSEDLARFKALTMGGTLVMGRKTAESLKKTLPGRRNVVLTRQKASQLPHLVAGGFVVMNSLPQVIEIYEHNFWVIGGAEIYKAFSYCTAFPMYKLLTIRYEDIEGDTFWPLTPYGWKTLHTQRQENGAGYFQLSKLEKLYIDLPEVQYDKAQC